MDEAHSETRTGGGHDAETVELTRPPARRRKAVYDIPDIMDSEQAAAYLGLHHKTVARLAHEGKIPGKKVGSVWRFRRVTLDDWLDSE